MEIVISEYLIFVVISLLAVASFVSILNRWLKIPYSIGLVIMGLLIGHFHILPELELNPQIVLLVFLPALLFEASTQISLKDIRSVWKPVFLLTTVGVVASTLITALAVNLVTGLDPVESLLLACIVCPTDPVSVVEIFRKLGVDHKIMALIEGESLFNDGAAVAIFKIVQVSIVAGSSLSDTLVKIPTEFVYVATGAILLGGTVGFLSGRIGSMFDDSSLLILITTVIAYGGYLIAEWWHISGIITVVVSGLVFGNYEQMSSRISSTTKHTINSYWHHLVLLVNIFIFIKIGAHIKLQNLITYAPEIAATIAGLLLARFILSYFWTYSIGVRDPNVNKNVKHLLFWGSLKGSLSMAMVMSLPSDFPHHDLLEAVTFGVVIFSLLVQGLTIEPLSKKLFPDIDLDSKIRVLKRLLFAEHQVSQYLYDSVGEKYIDNKLFQRADSDSNTRQMQLHEELTELSPFALAVDRKKLKELNTKIAEIRRDTLLDYEKTGKMSKEELSMALSKLH